MLELKKDNNYRSFASCTTLKSKEMSGNDKNQPTDADEAVLDVSLQLHLQGFRQCFVTHGGINLEG